MTVLFKQDGFVQIGVLGRRQGARSTKKTGVLVVNGLNETHRTKPDPLIMCFLSVLAPEDPSFEAWPENVAIAVFRMYFSCPHNILRINSVLSLQALALPDA
eukprot:c25483_g1_i1 orf=141-446(-)